MLCTIFLKFGAVVLPDSLFYSISMLLSDLFCTVSGYAILSQNVYPHPCSCPLMFFITMCRVLQLILVIFYPKSSVTRFLCPFQEDEEELFARRSPGNNYSPLHTADPSSATDDLHEGQSASRLEAYETNHNASNSTTNLMSSDAIEVSSEDFFRIISREEMT